LEENTLLDFPTPCRLNHHRENLLGQPLLFMQNMRVSAPEEHLSGILPTNPTERVFLAELSIFPCNASSLLMQQMVTAATLM
jgi:hypothetical protein